MKNTLSAILCISLLLLGSHLHAQTSAQAYQQKAGNFSLAFSGVVEKGYRVGYVNTPYYPTEYTSGYFVYRGIAYSDVKLRTDCLTKRLIVLSPDGKFNRVLSPDEVKRAVIGNIPYVYFNAQEATPGEGYYAALFEGKDFGIYKQIYVSNINRESSGSVMRQKFSLKERLFLLKDGKWNSLNGKNSFIKHFKSHKDALNDYCKTQNLRLGKNNESDWSTLATYCETLTK